MLYALEERIPYEHRSSLLRRFGINENRNSSSLDDLLEGPEAALVALAEYLDVPTGFSEADVSDDQPPASPSPEAAELDAYEELVSAETALRDVIRIAVPNWQSEFDADYLAELNRKRTEEDKRRDGIAVSSDLLDYTEIHTLEQLVSRHWDPHVKAILDDKKRTDVYLGIVLDVRNAVGHSRPVYPAERLLLAGAAGQIRNQLARYRTKVDGPRRHYPSLDSARDSMGNTAPPNATFEPARFNDPFERRKTPRLEVGETVTFELEATDPRGRDLVWSAYSVPGVPSAGFLQHYRLILEASPGSRFTFTWIVSEEEVGENRHIVFTVANGGRFHRHGDYDDACAFEYHVNPPPDA